MISKKALNFNKILYHSIYIFVGILVLLRGVGYYPDSYAFLNMGFNRSPVYNIFLKIFTSVFGDQFELPLIIIQYSFIVIVAYNFLNTIKKNFDISFLSQIIIQLIVLAPYAYLHFIANAILSEAIAYPLFLILFNLLLKTFVEEDLKYIFKISLVLFLLILTRGQFIAAIPVVLLLFLYIIYKQKSIFKNLKLILLLMLIPLFTSLTEKVYNKVIYGYFVNNAMSYVVLISSGFYISNESDVNVLKTEDEKAYFKIVYQSLKDAKLTRADAILEEEGDYLYYHKNFSRICNERIQGLGLDFFKDKGLNYYEQNIALNKLCSKMVLPLIKQNFETWVKLFFKNLKNSFGTFKQMLLFFMLLVYSLFHLKKSNKNIYKFIALSTLLMFANNVLLVFLVHSIKRYVFYFNWVVFVIVILLLNEILKPKHLDEY